MDKKKKSSKGLAAVRISEYRHPTDRTWARLQFLEAIQEHTPEVLGGLRDQVLPAYAPHHLADAAGRRHALLVDHTLRERILKVIEPSVLAWAVGFRLVGPPEPGGIPLLDSMGDAIVLTLRKWAQTPDAPLTWSLEWDKLPLSVGVSREEAPPFEFAADGWPLLGETLAAFKHRLMKAFEKKLEAYVSSRQQEAEDLLGLPVKMPADYFAFLARFQIRGKAHATIAAEFGYVRCVVAEGIEAAARAVVGDRYGEWLRESKPGRPKKTK